MSVGPLLALGGVFVAQIGIAAPFWFKTRSAISRSDRGAVVVASGAQRYTTAAGRAVQPCRSHRVPARAEQSAFTGDVDPRGGVLSVCDTYRALLPLVARSQIAGCRTGRRSAWSDWRRCRRRRAGFAMVEGKARALPAGGSRDLRDGRCDGAVRARPRAGDGPVGKRHRRGAPGSR